MKLKTLKAKEEAKAIFYYFLLIVTVYTVPQGVINQISGCSNALGCYIPASNTVLVANSVDRQMKRKILKHELAHYKIITENPRSLSYPVQKQESMARELSNHIKPIKRKRK